MTNPSTFSFKIRSLNEFYNIVFNGQAQSLILSNDLISNLKEFSNILLKILRDSSSKSPENLKDLNEYTYNYRLQFYPNLPYATLLNSLNNLIEIVSLIQFSRFDVGTELIRTFSCLAPFLSDDLLVTIPYTIAMSLSTFPNELHRQIMDALCNTFIPIVFIYADHSAYSFMSNSISSILTLVIEYATESEFYAQIFEAFLIYRDNFIQDVLCAIAYGSFKIKYVCSNLLYFYWPSLALFKNYKGLVMYDHVVRAPIYCQSEKCEEKKILASKVCLDPTLSKCALNNIPPFYMCNNCFISIQDNFKIYCRNVLKPVNSISLNCGNKDCHQRPNSNYSTCFSSIIIEKNDNKPMSFCKQCFLEKKDEKDCVFQNLVDNLWECEAIVKNYLVLTMTNLMNVVYRVENIKEKLEDKKNSTKYGTTVRINFDESTNNKRLLSKYGCALAIKLINPEQIGEIVGMNVAFSKRNIELFYLKETFGRVLSMVFKWFKMNEYVSGDTFGESISNFRQKVLIPWIKLVVEKNFELAASCLLPYPPEFARVGGVWGTMSKRSTQIKEEFEKLSCLISYDIITYDIWNYVMPYWIETIINEVNEDFLDEMKSLFTKLFDQEISTMTFTKEQIYKFISERLDDAPASIQEQALSWLQLLSLLDIKIPLGLLVDILKNGTESLHKIETRVLRHDQLNPKESQKQYYNDALQIFDTYEAYRTYRRRFSMKQISGQELSQILKEEEEDFIINETELNITCCIMMLDTLNKQITLHSMTPHMGMYNPFSKDCMDLMNKQLSLPWVKLHKCKPQSDGYLNTYQEQTNQNVMSDIYCSFCEEYYLWFYNAKEILAYIAPKDEIALQELFFYQLFDAKSRAKSWTSKVQKKSESGPDDDGPLEGIWQTSQGTFYFKLSNLHIHLQLFYNMVRELSRAPDIDSIYNLLECLKYLILHGEVLDTAFKDYKGFLIYCFEYYLLPYLWKIFSTNFCHLNKLAVKLLVYVLVYDYGKNLFWHYIERDFNSNDWKIRMQAVSRVFTILQNLNPHIIHLNCNVFSTIAFAFVNFIRSIEDLNGLLSQKSRSYIDALSENSLITIMKCLELQFDCVVEDREIIFKSWSLLFSTLNSKYNQLCFNWKFFLRRFNTLQIESIINKDDLSSENNLGQLPMPNEVKLARFALMKTKKIRLISECLNEQFNADSLIEKDDKTVDMQLLIKFLFDFMIHEIHQTDSDMKTQNSVLNHLYLMVGFNPVDQRFGLSPRKLRQSTIMAVLLSKLSVLMDRNLRIGNQLLAFTLSLLKHIPSPYNFHRESNESLKIIDKNNSSQSEYSIALLNPSLQSSWVSTLLVILYKYQYNLTIDPNNITDSIRFLLKIVLNTLKNSIHECNFHEKRKDPKSISLNFDTQVSVSNDGNETSINAGTSIENENIDETISSRSLNSEKTGKLRHVKSSKASLCINKLETRANASLSNLSVSAVSKKNTLNSSSITKEKSQSRLSYILKRNRKKEKSSIDKGSDLNLVKKLKKKPSKRRQIFSALKNKKYPFNYHKKNDHSFLENEFLVNFGGATAALATAAALCSDEIEEDTKTRSSKVPEDILFDIKNQNDRCPNCLSVIQHYSEENISNLVLICSTLVHRECTLAASDILEIIMVILKIASTKNEIFPYYVPCNTTSVARQAIRSILCQLAPNEIFYQLFQSDFKDVEILKTLANCLLEFNDLSAVSALKQIIHDINEQNSLNMDICIDILNNVAVFMEFVPQDTQYQQWLLVFEEFDILFKKIEPLMNKSQDYICLFKIIINLLKLPGISNCKSILDPFSKIITFIIRNCYFELDHIIEISLLCIRNFYKDRDRIHIQKNIINEFIRCITLKANCIDKNLLILLKYALIDAGGFINISGLSNTGKYDKYDPHQFVPTNAADCLKQYMSEIINFIGDIHTITKIKQNLRNKKQFNVSKVDDTLGAQLKAGLAQFLALELTELNKSSRDGYEKSINKYFPWLFNMPSNAQQGAKEFVECIDHIRILSWILIGSLTHSVLTKNEGLIISYPIPITCGHFIGEHVFFILNGFAEHSKTSAIHMSSLFHSFILCQLWTLYCEQIYTNSSENSQEALNSIMEFWTKITPGVLQLLSQNKVLAEMVVLHFLNLIEGLQEYNSILLTKLFPIWQPLLFITPLQGDQLKRAKQCLNYQATINQVTSVNILRDYLQRLQFKISMIESQSSHAAQLYN